MDLHGKHLIGADESQDNAASFRGRNPETGESLQPGFAEATASEIDRAVGLAASAQAELRRVPAARLRLQGSRLLRQRSTGRSVRASSF